jgi:hypothetical protein
MAHAPQSHSWHAFPKGTRVMDTVSGMDGVVVTTHLRHAVEPAGPATGEVQPGRLIPLPNPVVHETVVVKLENGNVVERSPKVLVTL